MERWRPIAGYESIYEVSDLGRVRSLERVTERHGRPYRKREKLLKPQPHTGGYRFVALYDHAGLSTQAYIHRLVLQAFCPINLERQANHKNLDKTDNRLSNLEWASPRENTRHARAHGLHHGRTNPNQRVKLTPEAVDAILGAEGSSEDVGAQFGVSGAMILHIRNGRRWAYPT